MCFPVGSSPQRLDEMMDGLAVIRCGVPVLTVELFEPSRSMKDGKRLWRMVIV